MRALIFLLSVSTVFAAYVCVYDSSKIKFTAPAARPPETTILTDYEMTNTDWSTEDVFLFFNNYPRNQLTTNERLLIARACHDSGIHPLVIFTKMELEQQLISFDFCPDEIMARRDWAMGYGVYLTIVTNGKTNRQFCGYRRQVKYAALQLRKLMNSWHPGMCVRINKNTDTVIPENSGTYALYRYTPFWGKFSEDGRNCSGNEVFMIVYQRLQSNWRTGK